MQYVIKVIDKENRLQEIHEYASRALAAKALTAYRHSRQIIRDRVARTYTVYMS